MSASQTVGPQMKYSYKFRLDPEEQRTEQETDDPRAIQAYIDGILGVMSKRYADQPGGISE
jgi:hypothetical protein